MLAATNNQIYLSASLFLLFLAVQNSSIGDLVTHSLTEPLFYFGTHRATLSYISATTITFCGNDCGND